MYCFRCKTGSIRGDTLSKSDYSFTMYDVFLLCRMCCPIVNFFVYSPSTIYILIRICNLNKDIWIPNRLLLVTVVIGHHRTPHHLPHKAPPIVRGCIMEVVVVITTKPQQLSPSHHRSNAMAVVAWMNRWLIHPTVLTTHQPKLTSSS